METQYFAAKEATDCANTLLSKGSSFFRLMESNRYISKIRKMWEFYHGIFTSGEHEVTFGGEVGELVNLPVNHFRNIAEHTINMISANRPIMEARAINSDYKSLSQTYLANGILDYYMREKGLEEALFKLIEYAVVLGSGFLRMEWNSTSGTIVEADPETGELVHEGEIEFSNLSPLDVVVDGSQDYWNPEWVLVRTFKNKYNLAAKFPELKDKILSSPSKTSESSIHRLNVMSNDPTDDMAVYEFFHKKTEAMPEGRYMLFVSDDCILMDVPIPYRVIPIFRLTPADILGTPYGYTNLFDVYPLQEAINSIYSTILTNQNAFGVQNLWVPRNADISTSQLEGGLNIIESNAKPEPLQLTNSSPESYKFIEMMVQAIETVSGINSVTRGNPEASLRSGVSLALVQSMSLQFLSKLQQRYVKSIEQIGTALIQILQDYAQSPKLVALVGKNNRSYLKEFTNENIANISRVVVDMGNPLSRSIAGRAEMAQNMAQMGLLKSPEQYLQIVSTGRLEVGFEGETSQLLLIKSENERMLDGVAILASILDNHRLHIMEHQSVIADPALREDPVLVENVQNHVMQHIQILREGDADLLQMLGQQSLASPQQLANAGGAPNMPPPESGPSASVSQVTNSPSVQGQMPNMPQVPGVDANLLPDPALQEQFGVGGIE